MEVENAGRLRLELDEETGLLVRLRRRPNAFNLLITESHLIAPALRVLAAPNRGQALSSVDGVGPQRVLELSTRLRFETWAIARTLRCAEQHTAQRVDTLDFDYNIAGSPDAHAVLRVDQIGRADQFSGEPIWILRGIRYTMFVRVSVNDANTTVSVAWSAPPEGTSPADIVISGTGRVRLAISVVAVETIEREPVLHALPVPLDLEAVAVAVACPSAFPAPLGRPSRLSSVRPHPLLVFPRDAGDPQFLGHVTRDQVDGPLRDVRVLDLFRRVHMAVFHGSAPLDELVRPLFDQLRALPASRLSTLLSIVWFSPSPIFLGALGALIKAQPLNLSRYESHLPGVCENIMIESAGLSLDQKLDVLTDQVSRHVDLIMRRAMVQHWIPNSKTTVAIPRDADLAVKIGLMAAARIRSGRPAIVAGSELPSSPKPWPDMPTGSGYPLSVEVAECLTADILASLASAQSGVTEDACWPAARELVRDGRTRLNRLVLISVGDDDAEGLLKSVPGILYASTPAAPVLAFRVPLSLESQIDDAFQHVLARSEAAAALITAGDPDRGGIWSRLLRQRGGTWRALAQAQNRLQTLLLSAIPPEYTEFITRLRPTEIVALTNLPIEWLRINGIPLGLLTKIAKLRVESQAGRLAALFDLARAYNSLTETNYEPSPDGFKALCIAPQYEGAEQKRVNESIDITKRAFAERLNDQLELQRDIKLTTLDGVVEAPLVAKHLRERWDLIVYVGHAAHGRFQLSAGPDFEASHVQGHGFEGATAVLLGCTTEGVADLAGSISNELAALGARGVFAMPARVHTGVMRELESNLTTYLIGLNSTYGDALQQTRRSLLWSYALLHSTTLTLARKPGRSGFADGEVAFVSPADFDIERFRDGWDDYYRHVLEYLDGFNPQSPVPSVEIAQCAAAVALNVTFMGSLHDRLFIF